MRTEWRSRLRIDYRRNYRNNHRVHFWGCSVVKGARPPSYRAIAAATAARLPAPHVVQKKGFG
jgi:hypothetical protein